MIANPQHRSPFSRHQSTRSAGAAGARWMVAVLVVLFATIPRVAAQHPASASYTPGATTIDTAVANKVRVAYLYNFTKYFQWPGSAFNSPDGPFIIGLFGDHPVEKVLNRLAAKKKVGTRSIVVVRLDDPSQLPECHLLFISPTAPADAVRALIDATEGMPLLTVGEQTAVGDGVVVSFFLDQDGTIGFDIDVEASTERKLMVSAKLLKLARVVGSNSG